MPKRKPDQVIRHEFALNRADREMVQQMVNFYSIDKVGETIQELYKTLKDPIQVLQAYVSLGIILELLGFDAPFIPGGGDWGEFRTEINEGKERARQERELTGEATLDQTTGPTDFLGRLLYNIWNPNWGIGDPDAPGTWEAFTDIWASLTGQSNEGGGNDT